MTSNSAAWSVRLNYRLRSQRVLEHDLGIAAMMRQQLVSLVFSIEVHDEQLGADQYGESGGQFW